MGQARTFTTKVVALRGKTAPLAASNVDGATFVPVIGE
jgi:hypothetical protein